jgi:hypothetical protein
MSQYEQDDLPPKLAKIAEDYEENLLHQNDRRGTGPKKRGKSILTTIKQTERYQKEFRHYHAKLELHKILKLRLTNPSSIATYAQWLQENLGKTSNRNHPPIHRKLNPNQTPPPKNNLNYILLNSAHLLKT